MGHTATGVGGMPGSGPRSSCRVWSPFTFQPLLGFYLDLEIVGAGGTLGKKRKVRNVIREGKRKESPSWTRGTEQGSTDSVGQGVGRVTP